MRISERTKKMPKVLFRNNKEIYIFISKNSSLKSYLNGFYSKQLYFIKDISFLRIFLISVLSITSIFNLKFGQVLFQSNLYFGHVHFKMQYKSKTRTI